MSDDRQRNTPQLAQAVIDSVRAAVMGKLQEQETRIHDLEQAAQNLREVLLYAVAILGDWKPEQRTAYGLDVLFEKAEAAIAKATGEPSNEGTNTHV